MPVLLIAAALTAPVVSAAETAPTTGAEASAYTPVTPVRVLDTRDGTGGVTGKILQGHTESVSLAGRVPANATAVVLNVTGTEPDLPTYITVFPDVASRPWVSSLNLAGGETRANLVTVQIGPDRVIDFYNNSGGVHVIADLAGYYTTGAGALFTPRPGERVTTVNLGADSTTSVDLSSMVPASATAVAINVTGQDATANTFLTTWPHLATRPTASTVNVVPGRATPNMAIVPLGSGQRIGLYNRAGSVNVTIDLAGFYSPAYGAVFTPVEPVRLLDTRDHERMDDTEHLLGLNQVPDNAIAATMNLTGILPSAATGVTTWLGDVNQTWNLRLVPGQTSSNQAVVPLYGRNPDYRSQFHNQFGDLDLAADLAGYFWIPPAPQCQSGCVTAWGLNHEGPFNMGLLGGGLTYFQSYTPVPVPHLSEVTDIADRYAVRADGTVWSWGGNGNGELGAGWLGGYSTIPVQVGVSNATAVAATHDAGWALRENGTVWGWGNNDCGVLGVSVPARSATPVQVLSGVTAIAAGFETAYALRSDGTVWAIGGNSRGQLGNGSTVAGTRSPVQVSGLTNVVGIAGGFTTGYALRADGTVWAWGENGNGALGNGSDVPLSRVPVQVSGLTGVTDVVGGAGHAFALRQDGEVWGWGDNFHGQLGSSEPSRSLVPVQVPGLPAVTQVTASGATGMALDASGQVWGWGDNTEGALGLGTGTTRTTPVAVPGLDHVTAIYPGTRGGRAVR